MSEEAAAQERLRQLFARLELMERALAMNTARLHAIEQHLGIVRQRQPVQEPLTSEIPKAHPATPPVETKDLKASTETPPPPVVTPPEPTTSWPGARTLHTENTSAPHSWMNEAPISRPSATNEAAVPSGQRVRIESTTVEVETWSVAPVPAEKRRDLESVIGGSWFNWIGILAVTFGVAFFLKFAFDKQWIGPTGRVTLSALVGIAFLYLGERLRVRGLKSYAYILSGGGILILYLADYAAYNFYHLIGQKPAFLLMAAVTTTTVLLSVRLNALPVAILGLVGGFLTPLLLSTGVDNEIGLFAYVSLLDAGVLAVAYFKRWRSLDFLSFAGTVLITLGWANRFFGPEKIWTTLFFLSVFFLLYALLPIFHNVLRDQPTRWFDVALTIANATFYFVLSYLMLLEAGFDHVTPATQALLVSVFFAGLFYTTWRWNSDDRLLRYSYVGAAATFLTIAVAMQLELHWVTIAWAVEALMLAWVGLRTGERAARHAALAVFCVAVGHWFIWDMPRFGYALGPSFLPLLNRRALSCSVLVGAIAGAAWLYRRTDEIEQSERETVKIFFTLAGNVVALTLLSLDINDYFVSRLSTGSMQSPLENARQFSISALWILYAASMLALGVLWRSALLRLGGLLLLLAAICKVIALDSTFYAASWHLPFFNQTFMAYALLVAVLALSARLYGRRDGVDDTEQRAIRSVCLVAANLLALTALTLEVIGYYDRLSTRVALDGSSTGAFGVFLEGKIFTLAIVWTIYATAMFVVGVRHTARLWRWGGLILLTLTALLVLASLSYYDAAWHTLILNRTMATCAIFIAALWLVTRTYARSDQNFEEASIVRAVATVAANVLAIVALSTQAVGYYQAKIAGELAGTVALTSSDSPAGLRNLELAKQLSLSVIWAVYASGLLIAGYVRRLLLLRVMGLALLSLTTLKVFIWDLSSLDRIYRIISFVMLGAILLVVSYFYQRSQQPAEAQAGGSTQDL